MVGLAKEIYQGISVTSSERCDTSTTIIRKEINERESKERREEREQ